MKCKMRFNYLLMLTLTLIGIFNLRFSYCLSLDAVTQYQGRWRGLARLV